MNKRLNELMIEAGYAYPEGATRAHKLAELILKECFEVLKPVKCQRTECGQRNVELLQEHFGVEE
jgi:hypothetical protein